MSSPTAAPHVRPADLVLRCYARRSGRVKTRWVAHCIDLDLWAAGDSLVEARQGLENAISGYITTVLDTDDRDSIPRLLRRRAPLRFVLLWHLIRLVHWLRHNGRSPLDSQPFEEHFPLQLAPAC